MFVAEDKFTKHLRSIVLECDLNTLGAKPKLEQGDESRLGLWCLGDGAKGALTEDASYVEFLLKTMHIEPRCCENPSSSFISFFDRCYLPVITEELESVYANLKMEQRRNKRLSDIALCIDIYLLSKRLCQQEIIRPDSIDSLIYYVGKLSVFTQPEEGKEADYSTSPPKIKSLPQSIGGKRHAIREELISFIRSIPNFRDSTAQECWNYLEEAYQGGKKYQNGTYSFYFEVGQEEDDYGRLPILLKYSWPSRQNGLEKEHTMTFKTFQSWVSKAKNLGN